jgi:hypothetical protein
MAEPAKLPLQVRKNIRDSEPNLKEQLDKIKAATGKQFTFEADYAALYPVAVDWARENLGDRVADYLEAVANKIEKLCSDDMSKEAFAESTSANKIVFQFVSEVENNCECRFKDGVLCVLTTSEKFCTNVSDAGDDIESRL